jgi:arginyl-tRNA synthetase
MSGVSFAFSFSFEYFYRSKSDFLFFLYIFMTHIVEFIQANVAQAVRELYGLETPPHEVIISPTRKEFEGDYTVTCFAFSKMANKNPAQIGEEIGAFLAANVPQISKFNVIKGFLNVVVSDSFWIDFLSQIADNQSFGQLPAKPEKVMVEYSSPNTNKPLHLGHIRNILLGWSYASILEAAGYEVVKVKVVNDRGIAICKSMLAWQKFGEGDTPDSKQMKGDHFVGKYYVLFEMAFKNEYLDWQQTALATSLFENRAKQALSEQDFFKEFKNEYFNNHSFLGKEARQMLLQWEEGAPETIALWRKMNGWVYEGFDATYKKLGVRFDKIYYESQTYTLGKHKIEEGLKNNVFYQRPDGSVWCDLTDVGLDHKVVLRADGTSVYITQDIGMAELREAEFGARKVVYTVADEQNYHFQVLFEILKKLGEPYANGLFHLSYGMVELPSGKMKSREGTVVDADELIEEVIAEAAKNAAERGESADFSKEEQAEINRKVGMAALKYHILKVNPKKKMVFDPQESVDLQGQTGPYIQYSYVRIQGVLSKAVREGLNLSRAAYNLPLEPQEKDLMTKLYEFPKTIADAAAEHDPSQVAAYCYELAKSYHKFWHDLSIFNAKTEAQKVFRLQVSKAVGHVLEKGLSLLGIEVPERM